jgi:hypothetical protein
MLMWLLQPIAAAAAAVAAVAAFCCCLCTYDELRFCLAMHYCR